MASVRCGLCESVNTKHYLNLSKGMDIHECATCFNAFTVPAPEDVEYEEEDFHSQFGFDSTEDLPRQWKLSITKQTNLIKRQFKPGSSILEIGCGQGLFLSHLSKEGYKTCGIEPSKSASNYARSKGLDVITGYYPHQVLDNRHFDLIIMTQVLEHVAKPIDLLNQIKTRNQGKHLLLVQTNYKGIVPKRHKQHWYGWLPSQHFWHFNDKGIEKLCQLTGLKLVTIEHSTLEHGDTITSKFTEYIPGFADQLHALIKL